MSSFTRNLLLLSLACSGALATLNKWAGGGDRPWGDRTAKESHPKRDIPETGVTRNYDFKLARATMAPDGVETSMILVNGQFPGPLIEANWGDWIEVNVHNEIYGPEEPTVLHWHGLNQPGTPWYDGVPGVSQCPIVPGASMTYRFRADEFGTSWWHSHQAAQYSQGLIGPIVIHGPSEHADFDVDLGPVLISDWYHSYYTDIEHQLLQPSAPGAQPLRPMSQSNLVGGAGRFGDSVVPYTSWKVEAGKKYKMRLVNTGSVGFETISIDNHKLTVVANDFIPLKPYDVDFVKLAVGQRTDVVFTASGSPGESYWFRAWNDPLCGQTDGPDGRGIIAYNDADPSVEPTSTGLPIPPNDRCATDDLGLTEPLNSSPLAEPDTTITIRIEQRPDANGVFKWFMNNVVYHGDSANPVLLTAITQDSTAFSPEETVYDTGSNKTVRLILENTSLAPHPMHLHGHDFQVLATGAGTWDGQIRNPSNPQRRDTEMMWGGPTAVPSYTVLQYEQDNPGIWALHCHIAWHLSTGMAVHILERPDELVHMDANFPPVIQETCKQFSAWQSANPGAGGTPVKLRR